MKIIKKAGKTGRLYGTVGRWWWRTGIIWDFYDITEIDFKIYGLPGRALYEVSDLFADCAVSIDNISRDNVSSCDVALTLWSDFYGLMCEYRKVEFWKCEAPVIAWYKYFDAWV